MRMKKWKRAARELALNILYQVDASGVPFDEAVDTAFEFADVNIAGENGKDMGDDIREYARSLVTGVREHRDMLDVTIGRLAKGWPLDRQPAVDRNILRIALYEIRYIESVPDAVAVDEAIEIAKKYSTADSGKFVNGVLAGYLRESKGNGEAEVESKDS